MKSFDFANFERQALAAGYEEVLERRWPPNAVAELHQHPFAVNALLVQGEMWLSVHDFTRHLTVGDTFELERDVPHSERYGADGATYWVARRSTLGRAG